MTHRCFAVARHSSGGHRTCARRIAHAGRESEPAQPLARTIRFWHGSTSDARESPPAPTALRGRAARSSCGKVSAARTTDSL